MSGGTRRCAIFLGTVFYRMSARGAHLILGARGEALIRKGRSFKSCAH